MAGGANSGDKMPVIPELLLRFHPLPKRTFETHVFDGMIQLMCSGPIQYAAENWKGLTVDESFDSAKFVRRIGADLVDAFEKARSATTAELVASAQETATRKRLEQILPTGVAVGTGCVIDTYGNTSKQTDVILYERDVCPVFRVNADDPKSAYYPCEGVIAVGEIKSVIGKKELEDSFEKIASVKSLKRNYDHPKYPDHKGRRLYGYRKYGERAGAIRNDLISPVNYGPNNAEGSKIYGFILGDKRAVSVDTMKGHYSRLVNEFDDAVCPNVTVFLDGTVFNAARPKNKGIVNTLSVEFGRCILARQVSSPFSMLISNLHEAYDLGGTAETEVFKQYYLKPEEETVELLGLFPIKGNLILVEDLWDETDFQSRPCTYCQQKIHHGDGGRLVDEKRIACATCTAGR